MTAPATRGAAIRTTAPATRTTRPATAPSRLGYTPPGAAFRTGTPLGTAASIQIALTPVVTGGEELSEARVTRPFAAMGGTPGLGAPNPGIRGQTVTTRGFIGGLAGGLGFAGRNTLLTARPNPATGPGAICSNVLPGAGLRGPAICGIQRR